MKFSGGMAVVAVMAAMVGAMSSGCAWLPWKEISRNIENSKQLRVGMTKSEVLKIMGGPIVDETYCKPDIWYYYVDTVWHDGLVTEDECMPLVFRDGRLLGWGNSFYADYRLKLKDSGKELEL